MLGRLAANDQNPIPTPVSALSRGDLAWLQTGALVLFGAAHIALAIPLGDLDRGHLRPVLRGLLVAELGDQVTLARQLC